jgi:hypothetical protein
LSPEKDGSKPNRVTYGTTSDFHLMGLQGKDSVWSRMNQEWMRISVLCGKTLWFPAACLVAKITGDSRKQLSNAKQT